MAKIIVTSRVTKNSPAGNAGNLVKYMGTREGVEKLLLNEETVAATVRQQRLIKQILKADPDAKNIRNIRSIFRRQRRLAPPNFSTPISNATRTAHMSCKSWWSTWRSVPVWRSSASTVCFP